MEIGIFDTIEIIISSIALILFIISILVIRKNGENLFFSMRSSNLMQITNISIFLSILIYCLCSILYNDFKDQTILSFFFSLNFVLELITFFSLILRYHRLYIICKIDDANELNQNKFINSKSYYYEYFYIRIISIFILLIIIISIVFKSLDENIMANFEILSIKGNTTGNDLDKYHYFWMIFSFIQIIAFSTYTYKIMKTYLNPDVFISFEIILITSINYLYFISIASTFLSSIKDKEFPILYPLIYNLLIYIASIGLPLIWSKLDYNFINYDLPGELTSSLYLFLSKEKCYDSFYNYLMYKPDEKDQNLLFLEMLINIFKYRLLIQSEAPLDEINEHMLYIKNEFLQRYNIGQFFEKKLINQMIAVCPSDDNIIDKPKMNAFEPITTIIYDCLNSEFLKYIKTEEFEILRREFANLTYVRCKLTHFGLIRS